MGSRIGSSVRRRMLGRRLRLLREEAGLTLDAAAPALDWSVSKLSRIEIAQQAVDVHGLNRPSRPIRRLARPSCCGRTLHYG